MVDSMLQRPSTIASLLIGVYCLFSGSYPAISGTEGDGIAYTAIALMLGVALFLTCILSYSRESVTEGMLSFSYCSACFITVVAVYSDVEGSGLLDLCAAPLFIFTALALFNSGHSMRAVATLLVMLSPIGRVLWGQQFGLLCIISGLLFLMHFLGWGEYLSRSKERNIHIIGSKTIGGLTVMAMSLLMMFSIGNTIVDYVLPDQDMYYIDLLGFLASSGTFVISLVLMFRSSVKIGAFLLTMSMNLIALTYSRSTGDYDIFLVLMSCVPLLALIPMNYRNGYHLLNGISILAFMEGSLAMVFFDSGYVYIVIRVLLSVLAAYAVVSLWNTFDHGAEPLLSVGSFDKEEYL